ncbi:MAG: YrbL family protein [Pseudomonadota bacterium]|nr:YrbL family protein [Pseudomonadota bacterium]
MILLLYLDESLLLGLGRDRACYQHPMDKDVCIKVSIKPEKQSKRECKYLSFLKNKEKSFHYLSDCFGTVQTNRGLGYMFRLVRDNDGQVAMTLTKSIENGRIKKEEVKEILYRLHAYLLKKRICAYDLSPNNLVVYKSDKQKWKVVIVDGVGTSGLNFFNLRVLLWGREITRKAWKRLERKVDNLWA